MRMMPPRGLSISATRKRTDGDYDREDEEKKVAIRCGAGGVADKEIGGECDKDHEAPSSWGDAVGPGKTGCSPVR